MYGCILVPTDGSDGAAVAFDHAAALARLSGAELHVVNAVDPKLVPPELGGQGVVDELEASGKVLVEELATRAEGEGLAVETAVLTGTPHEAIRRYATDHEVDLIVMGTHGRTGLDRWLLGSVAERVVRSSPVPVLTVRATE